MLFVWFISIMFWFLTMNLVPVIVVAAYGGSLGIREKYVEWLLRIFEWGSEVSHNYDLDEDTPEDETSTASARKRRSSSDLRIILREKSEIIDHKLHDTDEPLRKRTTVSVVVDDSLDFIAAGIEAIIEDQVTSRFSAEQLPSWNLLTRTRYSFQYINWKLSLIWFAGFLFRYLILVPIRVALFVLGMSLMVCVCYSMGHVSNKKVKKFLSRHVMLISMRIFSRSFSSIIRFHDRHDLL
ncbi:hypothetical protein Y032_0358g3414 [Ancylostoma ceylanicum]|uniref:Uncharacterized protein n=1 Tax=Ancylostoma ceylanicum TaxID=53326 RepID=A0A016RWS0_9BILA|nr:hypothetical protein Y032_0358g3414 [Ancylostoma ceylanicum]